MINYKSNSVYSPVDLAAGEFMFTFDVKNIGTSLINESNFTLKFEAKNGSITNGFTISNILPLGSSEYRYDLSTKFVAKQCDYFDTTFFNDKIIFLENEPLKLLDANDKEVTGFKIIDGETYIKTPKYSIDTINDTLYLKRLNGINEHGFYIRPTTLQSSNDKSVEYYTDKNNIFDSTIPQTYRIIIADKGTLISIWQKRGNQFEKIKTFSYGNSLEKADIYFSVDESMILSNLNFGFFRNARQTT